MQKQGAASTGSGAFACGLHAVDRGLLDPVVRRAGRKRLRGVPRQCSRYKKPAWAQDRRARESMVAQTTYVWTAAKFVPSYIRDPHLTHVLAAKGRTRTGCQRVRQPHAE